MNSKVLGSAMLIAGTCVGAVMLVLPLSLLELGSFGVFFMLLASAGLMYYSGTLVFEVAMQFPRGTDLSGMAAKLLGSWVGVAVNVLFSLLLYCLLALYLTGGAALIAEHGSMHMLGLLIWAALGLIFLVFGMKTQDFLNRVFVFSLIISYLLFVGGASQHVVIKQVVQVPFIKFWPSVAILATAFGYHVIIPSLRDYLGSDVRLYKQALALGLAMPLVLYLIWCFSLYGLLPYNGKFGLLHLSHAANSYLHIEGYLAKLLPSKLIPISLTVFMLTSIVSSYVGIALSLMQAITNKLKLPTLLRAFVVIVPPAMFAIIKPGGFLIALHYAAIIVALISLLLPVAMKAKTTTKLKVFDLIGLLTISCYGLMVIYSSLFS